MGENMLEGWEIKKDTHRTIKIISQKGQIIVHRIETREHSEYWVLDVNLQDAEPLAWGVQSEDNTEILEDVVPEILDGLSI
jgi:hypothetical protein